MSSSGSASTPTATTPTVGLDIGGTKVLGVLLDHAGEVLREERRQSPHAGVDALVGTASAIVDELALPESPVGVGAAGLVNHDGEILYSPNLPTIHQAPLQDALAAATRHRLIVDNDANVAARGEIAYGAARGLRHALLVTLGTGIGGGMLLDGKLYRGAHGFGGEIGHITVERGGPRCACGELGHWEALASGSALGRIARERVERGAGPRILAAAGGNIDDITGVHVEAAAVAGDADASAVLAEYADNVALGLATLANVLDPERIVIAGGVVVLGPLLLDPLQVAFVRHIEGGKYRPRIPIVPAELGERAGAVGAAVLARELLPTNGAA
jgi:glucokinase